MISPELNNLLVKARALATELRVTLEEAQEHTPDDYDYVVDPGDGGEECELAVLVQEAFAEVGHAEVWLDNLELQGYYSLVPQADVNISRQLAFVYAEFGFKSHERGENLQQMQQKLQELL